MAEETPISSLDSLGPQYGDINRPSIDQQGLSAFEGDMINTPEINFPEPKKFYPSPLGSESLNRKDDSVRNLVNNTGKPPTKGSYDPNALQNYISGKAIANQDKNEYGKVYSYDAGPSGNAFYKRYAAYGQKKFDEIGFSPLRDNEALFNSQTSKWDDFTRMMTNSFVPLFTRGFVSGPKSLAKMLQGDFSSDIEDARVYEEAAAIGQSSKGGVFGFVNNTAMNFAYTAGIISEAIIEEVGAGLLTAGTGGGAAPVLFATTANAGKNILKGIKGLELAKDASKAVNQTLRGLNNVADARTFWSSARAGLDTKLGKFLNPFENITEAGYKIADNADNLSGLARLTNSAKTGFGGFYRDLRNINMALSEARLEGGFVQNSVYDKLYDDFYQRNNRAPSNEEQKEMYNDAKQAGVETLWWNAGLIFASNKITLPNIVGPKGAFAGGLKGKIDDVMQLKGGKIIFEKTKDATSKLAKGEFKFVEDSFINTVKAFKSQPIRKSLLGAAGYMKANLMEGVQENAQEAIAGAYENYYIHNNLKNNGVGAHQFNKGLSSYLMDETYGQLSGKGFETFASGFFMGMFGSGFNAAHRALQYGYNKTFNKEEAQKYAELRNTYGKGIADKLTALYSDPKAFFNSREFNYGVQYNASGEKEDLSEKEVKDLDNETFISQVYTALETGTLDYFTDHLASMKGLSAEEFERGFGFEKGTGAEYQSRIDGIIGKAKEVERTYKEINERFPSPVDLSKVPKDHPDYEAAAILDSAWNMAKRQAIFSNQSFKNVTERMASIYETIANEPSLQKMSSSDLQILFEVPKMNEELGFLRDEIDSLKAGDTKDPKIKSELEFKKRKAEALDKYIKNFIKFNNYFEREQFTEPARKAIAEELGIDESEVTDEQIKQKLNEEIGEKTDDNTIRIESELENSYKEYLKTIAESSNTTLFSRDVDKAFIKLKDHIYLKREARILAQHINVLSDPQGYFDMVKRNTEWMSNVYNSRKKYFDQMVEAQLKAKENNDLLNALANVNVYVDLEEFQEFIESGVYPTKFYDGKGKVITQNHPKYREAIEMFNMLIDIQKKEGASTEPALDAQMQAEIDTLNKKMESEIDALAKYEQRVNRETLAPEKNKPLKLSDIAERMAANTYVELKYAEGEYITYYKDENNILRFDDQEGDEVNIKGDKTKYLEGVIYDMQMRPDPEEVQKIRDMYAERIAKIYDDYANKRQVAESEFKPITQDTPIDQMPEELINSLRTAFQTEVIDVMDEETQASFTDEQISKMFTDFVSTESAALSIIDEYNVKARAEFATRASGEKEDFTFDFEGKTINTSELTVPALRSFVFSASAKKDALQAKPDPTNEDTNTLNKYKILINDLEALIRTRSLRQMSPQLQEAKKKLDILLAQQERVVKQENGPYLIDGEVHDRVTNVVQKLKDRVYSYSDEKRIRLEFFKVYGDKFITDNKLENASPEELTELRKKAFIDALKSLVPSLSGFSGFTFTELEKGIDEFTQDPEITTEELIEKIVNSVRENTYEASRISGNYIDDQIKRLFNNEPLQFNEENITREAYDNLFSQEIDEKTGLPKGYLSQIKARVDAGELYILSQGLRVFDTDLKIAGEIDLIVADQNGNIFIVDVKTGSKDKWDKWKGTAAYEKTVKQTEEKIQKIEKDFAEGKITEDERNERLSKAVNYAALKAEDYELQQTAYSNLLYRMTGIETSVGLLPVEVTLDEETGKILTANKPSSSALKPGKFTIPISKAEVQDKINSIIPKVFGEEPTPTITVGTALSENTRAKFNRLGITDAMIELMTPEEIEIAKGYFEVGDAQVIINKYKDLAKEPTVQDDVQQEEIPVPDEEEEVVSKLTFGYTVESVKESLDAIQTIDELNKYRAELNGQVTLGNIPSELIPQMSELVKAKTEELQATVSTGTTEVEISKGSELIAESDIFVNNILFAPAGATLVVTKVDNTKKIAKLKYGSKSKDLTFDEILNNTTTMNTLNNQLELGLEELPQEDKDKVVISSDLTESFIKDTEAIDQAINEAKEVDDIQDLEDNLLNNLEC